ncbi:MAG: hypothetical protein IJ594_10055 [Oscillospiraceae bacterium]|nr:hypothetical protein [Oscillospiraceae bacterium]
MQKHLFLTGPTGSGKSSLIRKVLGDQMSYAGGLVTRQALSDDGAMQGYDLLPPAALAGFEGLEAQRFLYFLDQGPKTDNEVYRNYGVQLLQEAAYYPFAVLDEIGGFELIIPQFRQALEDLLNADVPILGALKTAEEAEMFRQYLGIGERFTLHCARLHEALAGDPNTLVLEMNEPDDEAAAQAVRAWAVQYAL